MSLAPELVEHLLRQYREHQHWSYQLHYGNLAALVKADDSLGPLRSYSTVRRYSHFRDVTVRYARWDLGRVDLADPRSGAILAPIYPLDRCADADGHRALLDPEKNTQRWLVEQLWGASSVGVIGGAPKCAKTWLGLDLALSVATGTPCLGKYAVPEAGPVLVYLAEDALPIVRERVATKPETTHLEVIAELHDENRRSLQQQVLALLAKQGVLTRAKLRDSLSVKNERLGDALESLEQSGQISRTPTGWQRIG